MPRRFVGKPMSSREIINISCFPSRRVLCSLTVHLSLLCDDVTVLTTVVKTWGCEILKGVWNADVLARRSCRKSNCCAQRGHLISER